MSIPSSLTPLFNSGSSGGLQIERSLRFNSIDSAQLSRVMGTPTNNKIFTSSTWFKRSAIGTSQRSFLSAGANSTGGDSFFFDYGDELNICIGTVGTSDGVKTTALFRDASAWYHILVAVDTTQATASNRIKLYVNGSQITTFTVTNYPSQNASTLINNSGETQIIGRLGYAAYGGKMDGYLTNIHFIDGQALTPSSFTETDATTGQLIPKTYTGSYGTNGFNLLFADNSSNTASTLGKDYSPNGNNWTPNNLSVTAGVGNDSLVDSPTNYGTDTGLGNEVRGNYATLNPLDLADFTLSNGNLNYSKTSTTWKSVRATVGVNSGKWYYEYQFGNDNRHYIGISQSSMAIATYPGSTSTSYSIYLYNGDKSNNGVDSSYASAFTSTDILGVAFDLDAATVTFYKNGTSLGTAFTSIASGYYFPTFGTYPSGESGTVNFGQRQFAYTSPSGYKALCTQNLPAPLVTKPNTVMDVALYTGNGGTQTISGLNFSPDFVWLKSRSNAYGHQLYDIVRGAGYLLGSNSTSAESGPFSDVLTAFTSTGFTVGSDTGINGSGNSVVGWAWDAGTSTVSNTAGSITSQVRANATAGFSVVTYTGNGSTGATVGHGLGVAPGLIIAKRRSAIEDWAVYHGSLGGTAGLSLNNTAAASTSIQYWSNTNPSSTTFTVHSNTINNGSGSTYVAYCFTPVVGYSSMGSYVAGTEPFVYLGFKPALVMIKAAVGRSTAYTSWYMADNKRPVYNPENLPLWANQSAQEGLRGNGSGTYSSDLNIDLLSNGFKIRDNNGAPDETNFTGATYIYCAWAESPLQYARAR